MRREGEIQTKPDQLEGVRSFFLVGIGGAGMSALAQMLRRRGFEVMGTDSTPSGRTAYLQSLGISVRIGHSGDGIGPSQAIVLTDAIDLEQSPEVARAREVGAPLFRRSQVLGWLLRDRKVIAVTGTHGKTTTTGMIGAGLVAAGMDPLIVVGASVPEFGGPVVEGEGEWAVVEACEAYDSFHDLDPTLVVLTNLELDHVDFHLNWENLKASVQRFVDKTPSDGALIYCGADAGARQVAANFSGTKVAYQPPEASDPFLDDLIGEGGRLRAPGLHNLTNARGAYAACAFVGAGRAAMRGILDFGGAERRLQVLRDDSITVIDDYAHHPTEIEASLRALNDRYPYRRLVVVYQPHLYSRTEPLIREFAAALSVADEAVLTDIYPAREDPIPGVSSARIAELISKPVRYIPNRHLLARTVTKMVRPGDVVVGMGAGNIDEFAPSLIEEIARSARRPRKRVSVVFGGDSAEREVSILSGREVHAALLRKGYDAQLVDVTDLLIRAGDLRQFAGPDRPDLAFLAVHGTHAEDGAIQGLFELLHIPYTGSGIQASAMAMDKELAKSVLRKVGIRVPEGTLSRRGEPISLPGAGDHGYIVKPNAQGSTVGLAFVERAEDVGKAVERARQYDDAVLIEEWIVGMEISVPVFRDQALPPVEIAPASGVYDFASKYTPGATEEIVPARLPTEVIARAQAIALEAHRTLGCQGATRTDMIVRSAPDWEIFVLEVNTLPGMTATSLLPNSARAAGIEFDDLVQGLVEDALARDAEA